MTDENILNNAPEEDELPKIDYNFSTFVIHTAKYKTLLNKRFENRKKYEPKDPNKILAFIPGTIKKINVKEGKTVKAGQELLVLDAMKMNNLLLSPSDGKIKSILVSEGDRVSKDQLLIELE